MKRLLGVILASSALAAFSAPAWAVPAGTSPQPFGTQTPSLLQIGTRTIMPTNTSGSNIWMSGRVMSIARAPANGVTLIYANYQVPANGNGVETLIGGTITRRASIEYPVGAITQCTAGGSSTATTTGAPYTTFSCPVSLPFGAVHFIRSYQTDPSGNRFHEWDRGPFLNHKRYRRVRNRDAHGLHDRRHATLLQRRRIRWPHDRGVHVGNSGDRPSRPATAASKRSATRSRTPRATSGSCSAPWVRPIHIHLGACRATSAFGSPPTSPIAP